MAKIDVHFSSKKNYWATPPDLFNILRREFGFTVDVCAQADNAKLPHYFDKAVDGLKQEWTGVCWMNPPYGREIGKWMKKAYESAMSGATVVCLVPARTDARWWTIYCTRAAEIRYISGRVKFICDGKQAPAPFPSAVVIFTPNPPEAQIIKRMFCLSKKSRRAGWWGTVAMRANRPIREGPPTEADRKRLLQHMKKRRETR